MARPLVTSAVIAHEAIHRLSVSGLAPLDFLQEVAARVGSAVRYDAGAWLILDPATLLQTAAFIQGLGDSSGDVHLRYVDNELLTPDFTKLTDVARRSHPVITLGEATGGDLSRSARHRTIHADLGVKHELRAAFRTGETTWGALCACRNEDQPDFSDAEKSFIADVSQHVGDGLRLGLLLETATRVEGRDVPGIIVIDADDAVESITPEAEEWLTQIPRDEGASLELPTVIHIAARQARAIAAGLTTSPAQSRIRLTSGRWLLVRASQLRHSGARAERTAVILEPARAAELAPLIIELYELSPRERQVTELLLRGLPIEEIAAALWISRHTVRDYTKAVFAKLGVGSRPELTAKLFHDHYLPEMDYATLPG
jgi:DNA-binding CsgD family transcriptional regulator